MFLHALEYGFIHPKSKEKVLISAPLPEELLNFVNLK